MNAVIAAVAVAAATAFVPSGFDLKTPHVNLKITNGNGYSNTLKGSPITLKAHCHSNPSK